MALIIAPPRMEGPKEGVSMIGVIAGRIMFATGFLILFLLFAYQAFADYHVFDVRKNLKMNESESERHDYYINAGTKDGVKLGMVFEVIRRVPILDPFKNKSPDDISIPIAKIKVIYVSQKISIARLHSKIIDDNSPILDFDTVMAGDQINIFGASADEKNAMAPIFQPVEKTMDLASKAASEDPHSAQSIQLKAGGPSEQESVIKAPVF